LIKQAMYFKAQNPGCGAMVIFDDLRTQGATGEDFYRSRQQAMVTLEKRRRTTVSHDTLF